MRKQLVDCISERHHNLLIDELGEDCERGEHLQVSLWLQVSLEGGNHQYHEVRTGIDEQGTRQIADSFNKQVLRLREVDSVDIRERGVVAQHFDVESADQKLLATKIGMCVIWLLLHFLLGQVALEEFSLEGLRFSSDDFVFFLFAARLADRLDQLEELLWQVTAATIRH